MNLHRISNDGTLRACNTFSDCLDIDKHEYNCGFLPVQVIMPYDCKTPTRALPKFKFVILAFNVPRLPATQMISQFTKTIPQQEENPSPLFHFHSECKQIMQGTHKLDMRNQKNPPQMKYPIKTLKLNLKQNLFIHYT